MDYINSDNRIIAIHQPNFLPWLGFFYKILKSDVFVFLDNVQFSKNSYTNRVKIKTPVGEQWLTVPIFQNFGQIIKEVKINNSINWREKHLKTLEMNYKKSGFFSEVISIIEKIYYSNHWVFLSELNIDLIFAICDYLGIKNNFCLASELNITGKSTELLISIVKNLRGNVYLSGSGGINYQDEMMFEKNSISLIYSDFNHPKYTQLWSAEFIKGLSIIDLLFNYGKKSINILRGYNEENHLDC